MAQPLTVEEAKEIAEQLGTKEILSPRGVKKLNEVIEAQTLLRLKQPVFGGGLPQSNPGTTRELSKAQILYFLGYVFEHEATHRSGFLEIRKMAMEIAAKYQEHFLSDSIPQNIQVEMDKAQEERESVYAALPGVRLETAIKERLGSDKEPAFISRRMISFGGWGAPDFGSIIGLDGFGYVHDNRSALGITLDQTLKDLQDIGLMPELNFTDTTTEQPLEAREGSYLLFAAKEVSRDEDKSHVITAQLKIARQLLNTQAITEDNFKALERQIRTTPLEYKFQYLPYLKKGFFFDLDEYPEDSREAIEQVFLKLGEAIPSIKPTNILVSREVNDEWGVQHLFTATYRLNGEEYSSPGFTLFDPDEPADSEEMISFYKLRPSALIVNGVNQWLIDNEKEERLFFQPAGRQFSETRAFLLVLLSKAQREAFGQTDSYNSFLGGTSFEKVYSSQEKQELYNYFQSIGLLDGLTTEELASVEICRRATMVRKPWNLLPCIPKVSVIVDDWESGNIDNPYEELTKSFSEASQGNFSPTKILDDFSENWTKKTTNYGFTLNGKNYSTSLPMMSDWLDPGFIDLINEALIDQNVGGKFYNYRGDGNIYLTDEQYGSLLQRMPELFDH